MGIKGIIVERDASNRGKSTLPPVLPKGFLNMSRAQFGDLVAGQVLRIANKLLVEEIICLEGEFKTFKDQTYSEAGFRHLSRATAIFVVDCRQFGPSWMFGLKWSLWPVPIWLAV